MSVTSKIIDFAKKYNKKNKSKERLKLILGASTFNVLLNLFFGVTGLRQKEERYLSDNTQLKDKYKGKRCFIIGNGPSVKKMDLQNLKGEYIFTVNQFTNSDIYSEIKPSFHLWADERFFSLDENNTGDMAILKDMRSARRDGIDPVVFYKITAMDMIKKYKLDECLNINYYSDRIVFDEKYSKDIDISRFIPWFPTVVQYAAFFAIYMGFSEIYLLGCDCTGVLNFIKEKDVSQANEEYAYSYKVTEEEKKHFKEAMNKRTSANEFEGHFKVFQYYEWIYKYCEKRNIKIANCTPGGLLDSLPRITLENVIGDRK